MLSRSRSSRRSFKRPSVSNFTSYFVMKKIYPVYSSITVEGSGTLGWTKHTHTHTNKRKKRKETSKKSSLTWRWYIKYVQTLFWLHVNNGGRFKVRKRRRWYKIMVLINIQYSVIGHLKCCMQSEKGKGN